MQPISLAAPSPPPNICPRPADWCGYPGATNEPSYCGEDNIPGHYCHDVLGKSGFRPCDEKIAPKWGRVQCSSFVGEKAQPADKKVPKDEEADGEKEAAEKPAKDAADGNPPPAVADAAVPGKFSMCRALTPAATDEWCVHSCATGNCPKTTCTCDAEEEGAEEDPREAAFQRRKTEADRERRDAQREAVVAEAARVLKKARPRPAVAVLAGRGGRL